MKISELKGARKIIRIECSCGVVWVRPEFLGEAVRAHLGKRERQHFIAEHAEHDLKSFQVTSTVTRR